VAVLAALKQIAAPQKRIGVKVDDGELLVEVEGLLGCRIRRLLDQLVKVPIEKARDLGEARGGDAENQDGELKGASEHKTSTNELQRAATSRAEVRGQIEEVENLIASNFCNTDMVSLFLPLSAAVKAGVKTGGLSQR
jgi:hypothetical protein